MTRALPLLACLAALAATALPAAAQTPPTVCNGRTLTDGGIMEPLHDTQTISGSVSPTTGVYYSFTVPEGPTLTHRFTFCSPGSSTYDSWLCLFDSSGSLITQNDDFCGVQAQISSNLAPGTYSIAVSGWNSSAGDYTLAYYVIPPSPTNPAQYQLDNFTPILPGGATTQNGVTLRATVGGLSTAQVALEVEVKPNSAVYNGFDTVLSAPVPAGSEASVVVQGLLSGDYKWRARARAPNSVAASAWITHPTAVAQDPDFTVTSTNQPPTGPTALGQYEADGSTAIPTGGTYTGSTVELKGTVSDPDGDSVRIEIEVKTVGTDFTGSGTSSSDLAPSGSEASLTFAGLAKAQHHWRARTVDANGLASSWVSFGSNEEYEPDFVLNNPPSAPSSLAQYRADGSTAIAEGGTTTESTVVIKAQVNDVDAGQLVRLDIEYQAAGSPFWNFPMQFSENVIAGQTATITIENLPNGAYHWQVRSVDELGTASAWVEFGSNFDPDAADFTVANGLPNSPTGLTQHDAPTEPAKPPGWVEDDSSITFKATVSDPEGQDVRLEIEVRDLIGGFFGIPTASSSLVSSGTLVEITVPNQKNGSYKWIARTVDAFGATSDWVSFGGNPEDAADLTVLAPQGYTTAFDDDEGWTFDTPMGGVGWAVDGTPAGMPGGPATSPASSLNYNNGTDFASGSTNSGNATSPVITIASMSSAELTFWCNYRTETTGTTYDRRWVRISNDGFASVLYEQQFSTSGGGGCAAMGTWHQHTVTLQPWWGDIQIRFHFDTVDSVANNFEGWFVDDMEVTGSNTPPSSPASLAQYYSDGMTPLPVGATVNEDKFVVRAIVDDPDPEQFVALQVEVQPVGTPFTGVPLATGPYIYAGFEAWVVVSGMPTGSLHWQARTIDTVGATSAWVAFPSDFPNPETSADLVVSYLNQPPSSPSNPGQLRMDGATPILVGEAISESAVLFRAGVSDPNGNPVRLEVEIRPVSQAFTGVPTAQGGFTFENTADVLVEGQPNGQWHWQIRAVDNNGSASAWVAFGGNADTPLPADVDYETDNTAPVLVSGPTQHDEPTTPDEGAGFVDTDNTVYLRAVLDAVEATQSVKLVVEVRLLGTPFTGAATHQSAFTASNDPATVKVADLGNGGYHWQYWIKDSAGGSVGPVSYGGNSESDVDFFINAPVSPDAPTASAQFEQNGSTPLATGATATGSGVIFKATVDDWNDDAVRLEVELRLVSETFSNVPTHTGSPAPSGSTAQTFAGGLAEGSYHWQARAVDATGLASDWVPYGGNDESEADFTIPVVAGSGYQTAFDTGAGWTFESNGLGPAWSVDADPASMTGGPVRSPLNSLNYNNGTDYNSGSSPNNGTATSPSIGLSALGAPELRFWCNYHTATTGTTSDKRWVQVSSDGFSTLLLDQQFAGTLTAPYQCSAWGTWHQHVIPLDPAWGTVQIRFKFDTVTQFSNAFPGWFIDDLVVGNPDPAAPDAPLGIGQFEADNVTPIPLGAASTSGSVIVKATISDPSAAPVRLEAEVRPLGVAFLNFTTTSSAYHASGSQAAISLPSLTNGSYHWQVRTVNLSGQGSAWTPFPQPTPNSEEEIDFAVGGTPPVAPDSLSQRRGDNSVIPVGGSTGGSTVRFRGTVSDPQGGTVRLQIEVRKIGVAFTGSATHSSAFVDSGTEVEISTTTGSIGGTGNYHWRARTLDPQGVASAWVSYPQPANAETATDFYVNAVPAAPTDLKQYMVDGSTEIPTGGTTLENGVRLRGVVTDANGPAKLQVEVRATTDAFTGVPTGESAWTSSGTEATASAFGLTSGPYHWRARTIDLDGSVSAWVTYPQPTPNPNTDIDFQVAAVNDPPLDPISPNQYRSDGVVAVAVGATTNEAALQIRANVSDPNGNSCALEVEFVPASIAFSGIATHVGPFAANNSTAHVLISGLADLESYHWRVRSVDDDGLASPWADFGGNGPSEPDVVIDLSSNLPPPVPTALAQRDTPGGPDQSVGYVDDDGTLTFAASVSDPDSGQTVRLEVEARPVAAAFSGQPTASGELFPSGATAIVEVPGLNSGTAYHWRARTVDSAGAASAWISFGGNEETADDFVVQVPAAYTENFENPVAWIMDPPVVGVGWAADATPGSSPGGPVHSPTKSLNYNNGTNFDNGATNSGAATSPQIDLTALGAPVLRFWCNYQTETTGTAYDKRWLRISADGFVSLLLDYQFQGSTSSTYPCAAMGTWHEHVIPLNSAWGNVQFRFYFDTGDSIANTGAGWFVDDFAIISPDSTPPGAIVDLAATGTTSTSATLQWTASGDDGPTGTAAFYDLRYSTQAPIVTDAQFASATAVSGEPAPAASGTVQSFQVNGLAPGTTYYFTVKSVDDGGNLGPLSNSATASTTASSDATPPASVTSLSVTSTTSGTAVLSWTAPGDDGTIGTAAFYDVRFSTSAILTLPQFNSASQTTGEPSPAPAGTTETWTVTGLAPSTTYFFALRTADEAMNWSGLSNSPSGTTEPQDTTPPAAVSDLAAGSPTSSSLELTWTAPGDDGSSGTAAQYDLRYSTAPIASDADYNAATPMSGEPPPAAAGTAESATLGGLSPSTTYYVAMKTADEAGNWSPLSNVASATTAPPDDGTPPAAVSDLTAATPTESSVTLSWTATGDDGTTGTAALYDLRYSISPILSLADFDTATQANGEPAPAPSGTTETLVVGGLSSSTSYHFALRVADEAGNWSDLSNVPTATTASPDTTPPAAVTDLAVTATTSTSATLGWSAPGDDGSTGTATQYDLRYSTNLIASDADFDAATPVTGEPVPSAAGGAESMTISGLSPGTTYYFALKTADEVPNWSPLSNVPSAATQAPDTTPPAAVTDLAVAEAAPTSITIFWTAPGDDGASGTAATYDLRWSNSPITTDAEFAAATPVAGEPVPAAAGTAQGMTVNGLAPGTTYHFALRTADEVPNWSDLSNSLAATTTSPDTVPPADVADLSVSGSTATTVDLQWSAPGDDGDTGTASQYDVRYSTSPITSEADFLSATQVAGEPAPTPPPFLETFTVGGLAPSTTYYFALRTSDEAGNWSGISNVVSATTSDGADTTAPTAVTDLAVTATTSTSATLGWSAPGDDGSTGTAAQYDLRYSTSPIASDADFDAATPVTGEPSPSAAGSAESMTISGLSPGTTYYFALKTADEVPNWSSLSNTASTTTSDNAAPQSPLLGPSPDFGQFRQDGVTPIPAGESTGEDVVVFRGKVSDADGDECQLEVEFQPVGTAFADSGQLSPAVASGSTAQVTVTLPGDGAYHWQARVVDSNGLTSAWVAFNGEPDVDFYRDVDPPTSIVLTSGFRNAETYPDLIQGTADDSGSGVVVVRLRIQRISDNGWWQGDAWGTDPVWLDADGTTTWAYPFIATDGESYNVESQAEDAAGHLEVAPAFSSFAYDTGEPACTVFTSGAQNSSTWPGGVTGTASDSFSGIAKVELTLRWTEAGQYWDGSGWVADPVWLTAGGTESWSYPFGPSNQQSYEVQARATDGAGNIQSVPAVESFTYNQSGPDSAVLTAGCYRAATWSGAISGTAATSGGAMVTAVEITLRRLSDDAYWDGAGWGPAPVWLSSSGTDSWSYAFSPQPAEAYEVQSRASDDFGNVEESLGTGTFSFDTVSPVTVIHTSGAYTEGTWSGQIQGAATDDFCGLAMVEVRVQRAFDGAWWNGTSWTSSPAWLTAAGTTGWSLSFPAELDVVYQVEARASDEAGHVENPPASAQFQISAGGRGSSGREAPCSGSASRAAGPLSGVGAALLAAFAVTFSKRRVT